MVDQAAVESALDVLRPSLSADGFDLRAGDPSPGNSIQVILEAGPAACTDCLVPDKVIEQIILDALAAKGASVGAVQLVKVGFDAIGPH